MDLRNGDVQVRARFWPVVRTALPAALPRYMGTSTEGTALNRARPAAPVGTRLEAPTRNARASGPRPRIDHRAVLRIVSSFPRITNGQGDVLGVREDGAHVVRGAIPELLQRGHDAPGARAGKTRSHHF